MFSRLRKLFWQVVSYFRHDDSGSSYGLHDRPHQPASEVQPHEKIPHPKIEPQEQQQHPTTVHAESPAAPAPASAPHEEARERAAPGGGAEVAGQVEGDPGGGAQASENRHERRRRIAFKRAADVEYRRLERARLKHDQWVTPAGPHPVERMRAAPEPDRPIDTSELVEPAAPAPEIDEANWYAADKLHYGEEVLVEESECYGTFNFRDTILDQLDRYWVYLERMKKHDPDSYGFYKQVGATLVPHVMHANYEAKGEFRPFTKEEIEKYQRKIRLPPQFRKDRPSFGCVAFSTDSVAEGVEARLKTLMIPKFMYFTKYGKHGAPPEVQRMRGGDTYKMTIWWDQASSKKYKYGRPTEYPIFISEDGTDIRPLRVLETKIVTIPKKHSTWDYNSIPQHAWHIPDVFATWACQHGLSADLHLAGLFCDAVRDLERTNYAMLRIAVHKGDMTAVFGLDPARMSYFFQDRDYKLTVNGHRKPIFHMVRPFVRADGTAVKAQFRGEKEFDWAGYHVSVTVPGLDHFLLPEMNIGMQDDYWRKPGEKYFTEPEFGKRLVDYIEGRRS
jgi:hypothetical protein